MKKISDLIQTADILDINGDSGVDISSVSFDSREVVPKSLFVAIPGNSRDGSVFIQDAIHNGACVIVHENEHTEKIAGITYIRVDDSRMILGKIAQNFYGNPSQKLKLIGVTGTNGKTTTATLLFTLFRSLGYNAALLSTIENKINDEVFETTHTTPDPIKLAEFLSNAVSKGCTHAFMECSSHAIHQKRIFGLHFAGVIFTNLTQDHLDYHKTMNAYAKAKKELFDTLPNTAFTLANKDDPSAEYMLSDTHAKKYFFSIREDNSSDFVCKIVNQSMEEVIFSVNGDVLHTKLLGLFNTYNVVGIYAAALLLGIPKEQLISTIPLLSPPSGRLEFMKSPSGVYAIVDYAHTPDAVSNILSTLKTLVSNEHKIITVIGCGGDRDTSKRSPMGILSVHSSDFTIFTSDNPRSEDPLKIIEDMTKEIPKNIQNYECLTSRSDAISRAYSLAAPGDIVLVAGKGHEHYQIFSDKMTHFSDKEELEKNFTKI